MPTVAKVWRLVLRAGAPVLQQLLVRQLGQVCNLPQHMRQRPPLPQHQLHLPGGGAVDAAQRAAAGAAIFVVAAICAAAAAVSSQGINPLAHAGWQQGTPLAGRWRCWISCERLEIQGQCCGARAAICSCVQCADAAQLDAEGGFALLQELQQGSGHLVEDMGQGRAVRRCAAGVCACKADLPSGGGGSTAQPLHLPHLCACPAAVGIGSHQPQPCCCVA